MSTKQFDSFAEAITEIRREVRVADQHLLLWQGQTGPGDHVVLMDDADVPYGGETFVGYAEILPFPDDTWPEPGPNMRWVRVYNAPYQEGEYGIIHANAIECRITAEQFALARLFGWPATIDGFRQILTG